jgi:O-antigen ligase
MQPIVDFLNQKDNSQWRYITFGFGDQFAYLNLLTKATTTDGSYHTARTLPELRNSGVGQVDTSYWALNGISLIKPILQNSGKQSVRWGFVNPKTTQVVHVRWGKRYQSPFAPLLEELGWKKIKTLTNGIWVYENPSAMPLRGTSKPVFPPLTAFAWGVLPMLFFVTACSLAALRLYPVPAEWVLRKAYSFTIALVPIVLCFWIYRNLGNFSHARVYFTYDNALFFASDALVLLAVTLWLAVKVVNTLDTFQKQPYVPSTSSCFVITFLALTTISIVWSRDWRTSLYIATHFWLITLLILSLRDWHEAWGTALYGLCAALSIQLIAGFTEFALQSTAFLESLRMEWPGTLHSVTAGASVVELANGVRILRAYGTLPHPNILGGLVLLTLLGPTSLFLSSRKLHYPALILLSLGLILLMLTFSRAAWLGWIAFISILLLKMKYLARQKIVLFVASAMITLALAVYPLQSLFFTRVANQSVATEQISSLGRSWLTGQALHVIQEHPITGVGIGAFILQIAVTAEAGAPIEPVHNIFLLVAAELGIPGLIVFSAMMLCVALVIVRAKSPNAILAGAVVAGFGMIGLFDHYLWMLAPGRVMLGFALGLWAGQVAHNA